MSNHEKVYGVCENKCFVEVYPKSSFIFYEGTVSNVEAKSTKFVSIPFNDLGIESTDKVIILSVMQSRDDYHEQWNTSEMVDDFGMSYPCGDLNYYTNAVIIRVGNSITVKANEIKYKVVLMKL